MTAVGLRNHPQRRLPGFAFAAGESTGVCHPEAYEAIAYRRARWHVLCDGSVALRSDARSDTRTRFTRDRPGALSPPSNVPPEFSDATERGLDSLALHPA